MFLAISVVISSEGTSTGPDAGSHINSAYGELTQNKIVCLPGKFLPWTHANKATQG